MENRKNKKGIGEYDFFKLLLSVMVVHKQDGFIDKESLEKELYPFYEDLNYKFLFQNISTIDNETLDLNEAFNYARSFGLVVPDPKNKRYLINVSPKQARSNVWQFSFQEVNAMDKMCIKLKEKRENLVKQKVKK